MKTLFLDIDGVLKPTISDFEDLNHEKRLNKNCLDRLHYLTETLDLQIVISSDWRHALTLRELQELFGDRVVGATKYIANEGLARVGYRFFEINEYCNEYNIKNYLTIDDTMEIFGLESSCWTFYFTNGWGDEPFDDVLLDEMINSKMPAFPMRAFELSCLRPKTELGPAWQELIGELDREDYWIYSGRGMLHISRSDFEPIDDGVKSIIEASRTTCEICGKPGRAYEMPASMNIVRCWRHRYELNAVETKPLSYNGPR